jgi:polyisoprenoid-binding protein YceI
MKKHMLIVGALSAAIVASTAFAQIASTDPTAVKAGTYKADPLHSQVTFSVSHFGFTEFAGQFGDAEGSLTLDPAHPSAAKLQVSVPIASVKTTSGKLDEELKGAQWLDSGTFPQATFTSTKVTPTGKGHATIAGNLTLHGVTKPVVLNAQFIGAGVNPIDKAYTVGFKASVTIKRSEFGVKTYVPVIGDDVELIIAGAFEKQG